MRKYIIFIVLLFTCSITLMACSNDNNVSNETNNVNSATNNNEEEHNGKERGNIPDDLIIDADADPIELKDQTGLEIGETGYAVRYIEPGELSITLNSVEKTQVLSESTTKEGDEFFLIGDFTFENVGEERLSIVRPDASKASDESAILNDEFDNGDLLGVGNGLGGYFVNDNNKIPDSIINDVSLEPGEKTDQKTSISMRGNADEYIIVFGFFDGNNKYYQNKVAWTFGSDQLDKK